MANSKNTIQNIPLTGSFNLNTLKTDVKQFEGYNDKNSTVFGGELTPFYNNPALDVDDDTARVYLSNSKGEVYKYTADGIKKYAGQNENGEATWITEYSYPVPTTEKPNITPGYTVRTFDVAELFPELSKENIAWCGMDGVDDDALAFAVPYGRTKIYVKSLDGTVNTVFTLNDFGIQNRQTYAFGLYRNNDASLPVRDVLSIISVYVESGNPQVNYVVCTLDKDKATFNHNTRWNVSWSNKPSTINPFVTIRKTNLVNSNSIDTYFSLYTGDSEKETNNFYSMSVSKSGNTTTISNQTERDFYFVYYAPTDTSNHEASEQYGKVYTEYIKTTATITHEIDPYTTRRVAYHTYNNSGTTEYLETLVMTFTTDGNSLSYTGYTDKEEGNEDLGTGDRYYCRTTRGYYNEFTGESVYTIDNKIFSASIRGLPIFAPGSLYDNNIYPIKDPDKINLAGFGYRTKSSWYTTGITYLDGENLKEKLKNNVIDNRYIIILEGFNGSSVNGDNGELAKVYDIENDSYIDLSHLGYIHTALPGQSYIMQRETPTQRPIPSAILGTSIGASGFNAGFELTNNPFVGCLINPVPITGIWAPPGGNVNWAGTFITRGLRYNPMVQSYLSTGAEVQSASYYGPSATYLGTKYPISQEGNIVLPYHIGLKFLKGYSNNDMAISNKTSYPLIYYSGFRKMYAYYMLSGIDDIEGAFALQGINYISIPTNILATSYANGIITSVTTTAYKEHVRYLGVLPTRAIFYSDFNKTFYQFTGDAIISKMMEASDLNEIDAVYQNPASMSVWLVTDKGIYVFSDIDIYRLDYKNIDYIGFFNQYAIVITHNEDGTNVINYLAFLENEINKDKYIPIKFKTCFYGLGKEQVADYDCYYIRLHSTDKRIGELKVKVNTITDTSFETEEKSYPITRDMYDSNNQVLIKHQPKYQRATAIQLELESPIPIYQVSLGVNATDTVAQLSKFNF